MPTRDRPNIPARRHLLRRPPHQAWATDSLRGLPISLARTSPMDTTDTRAPGLNAGAAPPPSGPVTLTKGMLVAIRTSEPLDSKKVKPGDYFQGTIAQSVYVGNVLAIPRGAQVTGRVVDVKKPGELKGGASIALQLTNLNLGGNSYALATDIFDTSSPGKGGYTAANTVGASALGAAIGAIAGGGPGAAIGAVAGAGVGLGASAATPGPRSVVPPESVLTFHLASEATVQPVSYQEANQLEASSAPQARRYPPGPYGYGPAAGYAPPPQATRLIRTATLRIHTPMSTLIPAPTCTAIPTTTAAGDKL